MRDKAEEVEVHRLRRSTDQRHPREALLPAQTPPGTPEQRLLELRQQAALLGWTDPGRKFNLP